MCLPLQRWALVMFLPLQSSLHALLLHWVVRTPNSLPYLEAAHEQGEFARALPLAAKPSLLDPLQARFSMFATRRLALRPLEVYHILRSTRRSNLCSRRAEVEYHTGYWPLEHTGFVLVFHTTQVTQHITGVQQFTIWQNNFLENI